MKIATRYGVNKVMTTCQRQKRGFTLVEMIIVVAVISILSAIAWSYFRQESMANRRSEAIAAITKIANELDEYHADNKTYVGYTINTVISGKLKWYTASLSNLSPTTYTVTLTPSGVQAQDTDCTSLTINETGRKGFTGSAPSATRCWGGTN